MFCCKPIGVFDSGIGGISVLKELRKLMPAEDYIYLADTANAPYGEKSDEEILRFSVANANLLIEKNCKAIVIACNTATAVAAERLRGEYSIPIFGIEPAIKPAVISSKGQNVLVLTTALTAEQKRFKKLVGKYNGYLDTQVYTAPVQKMVTFIERGETESEQAVKYLKSVFDKYSGIRFSSCVLGCTHFPFAKKSISKALGYEVVFFDGGVGTALNVRNTLAKMGLLNVSENIGKAELLNVTDVQIEQLKTCIKL